MLRIVLTALTIVALQTNLCPADKRRASEEDDTTLQHPNPKRTMGPATLLRGLIANAQITPQQKERHEAAAGVKAAIESGELDQAHLETEELVRILIQELECYELF